MEEVDLIKWEMGMNVIAKNKMWLERKEEKNFRDYNLTLLCLFRL